MVLVVHLLLQSLQIWRAGWMLSEPCERPVGLSKLVSRQLLSSVTEMGQLTISIQHTHYHLHRMYQHFIPGLSWQVVILFETDEGERGRFLEYALDRPDVQPVWRDFTEHAFVAGM